MELVKSTAQILAFKALNRSIDSTWVCFNHLQALADLKRTFHSFKKGFLTLRTPNLLVKKHLAETAEYYNRNFKRDK
jgi:hypothetical protein